MTRTPAELNQQGKQAFENGDFEEAAGFFLQAAQGFAAAQNPAEEAEAKNNLSVALLQAGRAQQALEAALGTDVFFESVKDFKRQAMALGNQAAALEALERFEEALAAYERSAALFAQTGEAEMRALVLKSAAALKLKKGKIVEAAFGMMNSLEAKERLGWFERLLKFFLRFLKK